MRAFIVLTIALIMQSALANVYTPSSDDITPERAQQLFESFQKEDKLMKKESECFDRAHMWARLAHMQNIKVEKVLLLFTFKFMMSQYVTASTGFWIWRDARPITWWFHIAPAVHVNGELWALDARFSPKAEPVQTWARALMKEPEDCMEMNNINEYVSDRNISFGYNNVSAVRETCYMTTVPRNFYGPVSMGLMDGGKVMRYNPRNFITESTFNAWEQQGWDNNLMQTAHKSYEKDYRKDARRRLNIR